MTTETPKRIPYGKQNWEDVRLGKSLLMNMLRQYYDLRKADRFNRLFGDLWIGSHPTPTHNKYLVLYLNFSLISGGIEGYEKSLNNYCRMMVEDFFNQYSDLFPVGAKEGLEKQTSAKEYMNYLNLMAWRAGQQVYLFSDEEMRAYDKFWDRVSTQRTYEEEIEETIRRRTAYLLT